MASSLEARLLFRVVDSRTIELSKNTLVRLFVKSHHERLALSQSRCSQVTGRPKQKLQERLLVRFVALKIQVSDLLALGGVNLIHLLRESQCFFLFECCCPRVDLFNGFDPGVRKKLLRFSTGFSAATVITPVQRCHRFFPFFMESRKML